MRPLWRTVAALLWVGGSARGQTGPEPVIHLEPVVVQGALLTDSPATVTTVALAPLPLDEATTAGLAARSANFFIASNESHSYTDIFAFRGLTNTSIFGDPAVSFYLDDVPLGSGFTYPVSLAGFASAELHRGPTQNTVFGRAGSAGVVTLRTPEPGSADQGELRVAYGSYASRELAASTSTAAGGAADVYVSADYAARNGYITNTTLARAVDDKEASSGLARLRLRPGRAVELTLLVTALRARDGAQPLVPLGGPYFTVTRASEGQTDVEADNAAITAAFATPLGRLTATTSGNDWSLGPYQNTLALGPADLVDYASQRQQAWNEEWKLVSDAGAGVRWQAGAFFSDGDTTGAYRRVYGGYPYEASTFRIDARDLAAFGEATFTLTPALALTAGLRVEDSRKTMHRVETVPAPQTFDLEGESTALLPKLGLSYTPARDTSFFLTAGAGYKPGGFSTFTGIRSLAAFGPERTKTLEAGVTSAPADRRLSATLRLFYYDITGYQIERSFATGGSGNEYLDVNAPRARSFGGELELRWNPVAGLNLAADAGATEVTLTEFTDPFTGVSYAGNRAPAVPAGNVSLRADYRAANGFFGGVEVTAIGRTYYTEAEDLAFGQRAHALLGVSVGYAHGRHRLTLYGRNLTDNRYYSAITPGVGHGTPGAPRTVGVELKIKL